MLIRFALKNLFSFKEETEFNLLPGRVKRLNHHKYERNNVEILKLTALYGANGSGKSNLIRAISLLKMMLINGKIPNSINSQKFKLSKSCQTKPVELLIEFFANQLIYCYSISINEGIITDEYFSYNGKNQEDVLVFHRRYENKKHTILFSKLFEEVSENKTLKKIIEHDLLKPNQPLFSLLNTISSDYFNDVKIAFNWLENDLIVVYPESKPSGLVLKIDQDKEFKIFATELMSSFNTGISGLKIETKEIEEFLGIDNQKEIDEIKMELENNPDKKIGVISHKSNEEEVFIVSEEGKLFTKRLLFEHKGEKEDDVDFKFVEESDGTRRLLEYLPALNDVIKNAKTYIVDEIERSVHPLIIKEVVKKFSKDQSTLGQLIFSTHESNLLDQDIFRPDEIWFAQKNTLGQTKLYPLSDFKEHSTIDIQKGYLSGRYGAIPFLGNLHDLNWNKYNES